MTATLSLTKIASLIEELYQEHKHKDRLFTIQSISKPFVFGLALETHGLEHVRSRVNVEPTGEPFHSMIKLDESSKRPPNPLVNSGAIAMTSLIKGDNPEAGQARLKQMYELYTGRELAMDDSVYESERATGHRNRAIAHLMLHFGMVEPEVEETVDLYFRQCSFNITTSDLSTMAATLANKGINPLTGKRAINEEHVKSLLTLMLTCGLYTYAGEWAFNVGLPAKSGVSGGILAAVPGKMGIGVYSPLVDTQGNSVRGVRVFKDLERVLNLHIFH
jgi:glutaminase